MCTLFICCIHSSYKKILNYSAAMIARHVYISCGFKFTFKNLKKTLNRIPSSVILAEYHQKCSFESSLFELFLTETSCLGKRETEILKFKPTHKVVINEEAADRFSVLSFIFDLLLCSLSLIICGLAM